MLTLIEIKGKIWQANGQEKMGAFLVGGITIANHVEFSFQTV